MASVTGVTAEKHEADVDALVANVAIASNGAATKTTRGGTVSSIGSVGSSIVGAHVAGGLLVLDKRDGGTVATGIALPSPLDSYPVGAVYTSVVNTSPQTLFGGTWVRFGAGRVPVGWSSGDTDFGTVEGTGGVKTVTLTTAQIPAHSHSIDHNHPAVQVKIEWKTDIATGTGGGVRVIDVGDTTSSVGDSTAQASVDVPDYSGNSGSTGGGGSHTNLQPFVVVYMWKRTA